MDNVELGFDNGNGKGIIRIRKSKPGSTLTLIRSLLRNGLRGDEYYFRNNDRRLVLAVWERQGLRLTPEQRKKFYEVTFPDTITRARREFRGEFPESKEVMEQRYKIFLDKTDEYSAKVKPKGSNFLTRRLRHLK